ncbi:MAG: ABC transporter ATP-binding protein [Candidatus Cloacimonetes bacterium HGW-Cloacimonetes-1]|jgi:zinc transport system ATP-binding protein|nr:MAG: ABC transporter ATP-binding protein [Candidatus Cloacimonetes bacterium HGW-Cloacimonetes-1]
MIIFNNVNYNIDGKSILMNIDFTIKDGEFVAIVGPNGAGKSTLIKLLLGLIDDFEGSIEIDGFDHIKWLRQHPIGYLPQKEIFDRHFPATALDIALMGLASKLSFGKRFSRSDIDKAKKSLEVCGAQHLHKSLIGSLSGGEFQRVLLARALLTDSPYIVLDEPEASIDRPGVLGFFEILRTIHATGKTIITISHDLHTLSSYCTFLVCLNKTLHCHSQMDLVDAEVIQKTFGESFHIIEKDY